MFRAATSSIIIPRRNVVLWFPSTIAIFRTAPSFRSCGKLDSQEKTYLILCRENKISSESQNISRLALQGRMASTLTFATGLGINNETAVAATRGDLVQLVPRKKLLKSVSRFPEDFLSSSERVGTQGF